MRFCKAVAVAVVPFCSMLACNLFPQLPPIGTPIPSDAIRLILVNATGVPVQATVSFEQQGEQVRRSSIFIPSAGIEQSTESIPTVADILRVTAREADPLGTSRPGDEFTAAVLTKGTDFNGGDTVTIVIENKDPGTGDKLPPIAIAGIDQAVVSADIVQLDGTASIDPDGGPIAFAWSQTNGLAVLFDDATSATPTFQAPQVGPSDTAELVFELLVTDDEGQTATDQVVVTVQGPDVLKVTASANPTRIAAGKKSTLSSVVTGGTAPFTFKWTIIAPPNRPAGTLTNGSAASATWNSPAGVAAGVWRFEIQVTDFKGQVATAQTSVQLEADCDGNGIIDVDELESGDAADCNENGIIDACESKADCNTNGIPDECEGNHDCNTNGLVDECEILFSKGTIDCNTNGLLDVCDLLEGVDCDGNGRLDECDLLYGADDCNTDGILDICHADSDCNENGIPDECEDCNGNGVADECDIWDEYSNDCDSNGVPDECEDCNTNGYSDACDILGSTSNDCDENGIADDCEDCNGNGFADVCDISGRSSADDDMNGIPDECEVDRLYVDPDAPGFSQGVSWDRAYRELQTALHRARQPSSHVTEIWVAEGTYYPDGGSNNRRNAFRLINGVSIYGGFSGTETLLSQRIPQKYATILSGGIGVPKSSGDNSFHVVIAKNVGPSAKLDGFYISDGHATDSTQMRDVGAGMLIQNASPTIVGCSFSFNLAAFNGGGVYVDSDSAVDFANCDFSFNSALQNGGGVYLENGDSVTFDQSRFFANNVGVDGGGIYSASGASMFTFTFMESNVAGNDGGAAFFNGVGSPQFIDLIARFNDASNKGGAIFLADGSDAGFDDATFENNSADVNGGAVYSAGGSPYFQFAAFRSNGASNGGALYFNAGMPFITSCEFTDNGAGTAAAIYFKLTGGPYIEGTTFSGNIAQFDGGAIVSESSLPILVDATFFNNTSGGAGGAVSSFGSEGPEFDRCGFYGNVSAQGGGAIFGANYTGHVTNSIMSGNQVTGGPAGGSAVLLINNSGFTMTNCTVAYNTTNSGGAMHATNAFGGMPSLTINNSILWGNDLSGGSSTESTQISTTGTNLTLSYSCIQWLADLSGVGLISQNPLFVDAFGMDGIRGTLDDIHRLMPTSPCIDAANSNADIDSVSPGVQPIPDLDFAGELRFIDMPAVSDTGVGMPPIVDMGAHEVAP